MLIESRQAAGDAEVRDLEIAFAVEHQVRRLQIAMDDSGRAVRVVQRVANLHHPRLQLLDFENLVRPLHAQRRERRTIDVLHGNARRPRVLHEVVNADDVLVRQLQAAFRLALQIVEQRGVMDHQFRQKLERDLAVQLLIARLPHDAHPAATEDA